MKESILKLRHELINNNIEPEITILLNRKEDVRKLYHSLQLDHYFELSTLDPDFTYYGIRVTHKEKELNNGLR